MQKGSYKSYNVGVEHLNSILNKSTNEYTKDITQNILSKNGFIWEKLDDKYIENIVKIANKIKE